MLFKFEQDEIHDSYFIIYPYFLFSKILLNLWYIIMLFKFEQDEIHDSYFIIDPYLNQLIIVLLDLKVQ